MNTMDSFAAETDSALFTRAQKGDRAAFGHLVERHQTLACSIAYSICGDFARSQDVAQEAFIAAWLQLAQLNDAAKFRPWLCGITRNLACNLIRRQARRADQNAEPLGPATEPITDAPDPREATVTREEAAIVWRALERLPGHYREPLVLFYREHCSLEHVAVALDLSEDAVKQRLSRGRAMLREQVETLIARSLGRTRPDVMFTTAVLTALPAVLPQLAAAAVASGAGKASAAKFAVSLSCWSAALGPALGLLGACWGTRAALNSAHSPAERAFMQRTLWTMWVAILVANGALLAVICAHLHFAIAHPFAFTLGLLGWVVAFGGGMSAFMSWSEHQRRRLFPTNVGDAHPTWHYEYRSRYRWLGLPLVHLSFGNNDATGRPKVAIARGWIAIGNVACGAFLAIGGVAVGGIAVGGVALGGLAMAGACLGLATLGGVSIGVWAIGGLAIGWSFAWGGIALAREIAVGGLAAGAKVNLSLAEGWSLAVARLPVLTYIVRLLTYLWLPALVSLLLVIMKYGQRLKR